MMRTASMGALSSGDNLEEVCRRTPRIADAFDSAVLSSLFKPEGHLGHSGRIVDMAVTKARARLD